jgi:predicted N-formylglutamate amidohydrolase
VADPASADVEIVRHGGPTAAAIITCEHASERLPEPWKWPDGDARLWGTHWAYDPGAAELARELAAELHTVAVLARFSRLLADPNRPENASDLFRREAEGEPVLLNSAIDARERERRLVPWRTYHDAVDAEVRASAAPVVLAMHTFTPLYEGTRRTVEVGVLFDEEQPLAEMLQASLIVAGFKVELNQPYSGKLGLMYSVGRHGNAHGRRPIELEVRQDLAVDAVARTRVVRATADVLTSIA